MSSTRDQLEASLRARCDHDTLAVYADYLIAHDDPRGELIALDLNGASASIDLDKRRGQLLKRWLGEDFELRWDPAQRLWYIGDLTSSYATFDCGFVDLFVNDTDYAMDLVAAQLLAVPAGEFLRRLALSGPSAMLELVLEVVVSRRRGWLQHLALSRPPHETPLLVPPALAARLMAATPSLEVLDVKGRNLLDRFTHPNVRELGVTGCDAIDLTAGPPLPALHTIDFALDGDRPLPRGWFAPERVPAVRRLCLSRDEGNPAVFGHLGTLAIAPQLTHLVLPSVRTRGEAERVQAAIDRMPMLREITIERAYASYGPAPELRHPWARIRTPTPWPWRPRDQARYEPLRIDGHVLDLSVLIDALEEHHDDLPEDLRLVWYRFWLTIEYLESDDYREQTFSAQDLVDALAPFSHVEALGTLRDHLARARPGMLVMMRWD